MEKLLVLSNFFFCYYVFKKPSAAEASESIYMRERVKDKLLILNISSQCFLMSATVKDLQCCLYQLNGFICMLLL